MTTHPHVHALPSARGLFILIAALLVGVAPNAFGLSSCAEDAGCKADQACHGGVCIPKALLCTSDAGCAAHKACDFTCPHGGDIAVGSGSTEPVSTDAGGGEDSGSDSGGSGGSSDGSSGSSSGSSGSGSGSSGSGSSGSGAAPAPGDDDGGNTSTASSCPKTTGVCVFAAAKVTPTPSCVALCNAAAACDLGGDDAGDPPSTETKPLPGTGSGSSSGSGGSGSGGSGDSDGGSDGDPEGGFAPGNDAPDGGSSEPDDGGSGAPAPDDDKASDSKNDIEACTFICTVFELENIAAVAMSEAKTCVAALGAPTCETIEANCGEKFKALATAIDADEDKLALALGGGFGGSSSDSASTKGGANEQALGGGGSGAPASDNAGGAGGAAAPVGGATGGCTASPASAGSGGALLLLALLALALRRRAGIA